MDMVSLFNEFFYAKNRDKRKYYQSTFTQSEKDRVKRKWKEKMNQLQNIFCFLISLKIIMFEKMKSQKII